MKHRRIDSAPTWPDGPSEGTLSLPPILPDGVLSPPEVPPAQRAGSAGAGRAARLRRGERIKRAVDVVGAVLLILLCAPACVVIALLIRLEGAPVLYGHERIGRGGRRFSCLKFRTMVPDADRVLLDLLSSDPAAREEWETTRKLRRDPRITPFGRFLRASSLDELPQLLNVLRGEMSLVGPRPVLRCELDTHYGPDAETYMTVRPGITGLWQVSGRSDTSYERRVALDVAYVRSQPSLRMDVRILLRTVRIVLLRQGSY